MGLFRSATFVICAIVLIYSIKTYKFKRNLLNLSLLILFLSYFFSNILNKVNVAQSLIGGYQRNFGLLTLISLIGIFLYYSQFEDKKNHFEVSLWILIITSIIYGFLQLTGNDPLPWKNSNYGVQLTLGNPNFSGAFIGMLTAVVIHKFNLSRNLIWKIVFGLIFILQVVLAIASKSIQAEILILIVILVYYFVVKFKLEKKLSSVILKTILITSSFVGIFVIYFFTIKSDLREKFFYEGSVYQRLDYWKIGLRIFIDHPIFGVGSDQFSRYSALYRSPDQVIRDGAFIIPDRAHSVFIDHLSNGGIFAGSAWLFFIFSIYKIGFRLVKQNLSRENRSKVAYLLAIWSAYIIQTFISPDQLTLTTTGFATSGILVFMNQSMITCKKEEKFILFNSLRIKIIVFIFFIISIGIYTKAIWANSVAKSVIGATYIDSDRIMNAIYAFPEPKTIEKIAINTATIEVECDITNKVISRLLAVDDMSSQAWYIKAVCASQAGKPAEGLNYVEEAMKFDPINPVFLIGQAKLAIGSNNLEVARQAAKKLNQMYPLEPSLVQINDYLAGKN